MNAITPGVVEGFNRFRQRHQALAAVARDALQQGRTDTDSPAVDDREPP